MHFIGKILPVEGYYVVLKTYLPVDYGKSLTHLYQPLIGTHAVTLYQTLLHDMELQREREAQTHHTLMNYLNIPLDEIYQARLKLEAIGLLKTYKQNTETTNMYTYELQSPFAPKDFFKDAMLTQLLFHHIGDAKFKELKNHYVTTPKRQIGTDITASFHDVFQTFEPSLGTVGVSSNEEKPATSEQKTDFSWIEMMLKQRMIPVGKVLTPENKKLISQMMQLYDLYAHEIDKSVLWALTSDNRLDAEEFKTACHDLFKQKYNDTPIQLKNKAVSSQHETTKKPETKEDQLIHELEIISPKQLLEDLSSGNHASEQDMRVIRGVMTTQGLPSPVMNVLIHYVLLQSNMKLSKAYLEKIASHWSRANLKTAKEAMAFAKKEKDRYQKGAASKSKSTYRKAESNEVVPDWFKERKNKNRKQQPDTNNIDTTKEQEEVAAMLRQYSSRNKNNHIQG
ncbi:DnaD domain protein [Virgibacillus sp. NKC19-3]|uniref:replication initiation and membrane attachment family protein n=1 Tax=Virgibacillus saliphilus TaxID=2831674 RepID=UPI001C9BB467|nr:DnaD domain protein [Virgibacillus sp. NKC19-3]MBY7143191.1 DnaD domain protein [Virgibacillus sp. NKC19-3]